MPPSNSTQRDRRQKLLNLVLLGLAVPGFVFGVVMLILWAFGRVPISGALAGLGLLIIIAFTEIYSREISTALQREQSLSEVLKENQTNLEQTITEKTRHLSRRLVQIRTAAEISRSIGAVLEPGQLMSQVVNLILERFNLYYVGAFLLDDTGKYAVLKAGTGEPGEKMLAEGHHLTIGGASMIGWAISHHQARIALDVGEEAVRFNNPHLPKTRSELALPLLTGKIVLGAISIQSDQPEAFDQDDITVLQGIADSLATALENARLFQQVEANLAEIKSLHRNYLAEAWREFARSRGPLDYRYENDLFANNATQPETSHSFPMMLRDQIIGELTLETDQPNFSPEDVALIEGVINQTAVSLENARLLEEAHRLALREQKINSISNRIRASVDLDTILQNTVRELGSALGSAQTFIQIGLDEANGAGENPK